MFWPFTVWINCSSALKIFANSRLSASNLQNYSQPLEPFFFTVCQNNFCNKIPLFHYSHANKVFFVDSLTFFPMFVSFLNSPYKTVIFNSGKKISISATYKAPSYYCIQNLYKVFQKNYFSWYLGCWTMPQNKKRMKGMTFR